jgi:hypothetical protein
MARGQDFANRVAWPRVRPQQIRLVPVLANRAFHSRLAPLNAGWRADLLVFHRSRGYLSFGAAPDFARVGPNYPSLLT